MGQEKDRAHWAMSPCARQTGLEEGALLYWFCCVTLISCCPYLNFCHCKNKKSQQVIFEAMRFSDAYSSCVNRERDWELWEAWLEP